MEHQKDKHEPHFREIAEHLSRQPEWREPEFWKEYFYWSWRCLLFVLIIVVVTNFDMGDGFVGSFGHISPMMWVTLIVVPLLVGPAFVVGLSYLWMWGRDLIGRIRE